MSRKIKWTILIILLLALLGGGLYYFLNKKFYPKVKDIVYLNLDLAQDTARVKAGLQIQNRIPLPISVDSVYYVIKETGTELGWGQMTTDHRLPPLGNKVVDFKMLLDFEKYRKHIQQQEGKDSIELDLDMKVYFDLPLISQQHITLNRSLKVPVPKSPSMQLADVVVRSFSPDSGYVFVLKIDASNQTLPNLHVKDFSYKVRIGDTLTIEGEIDTTIHIRKGEKMLEVPLQLETSEAIALIKKKLSGDTNWKYTANVGAQIQSDHHLLDKFQLTVEKTGTLDISKMGSGNNYLPSIQQIKRMEVNSTEAQTLLQAAVVVHNPSPIPFYIDSASYYIRHKGKLIASGRKDFEKVLPKTGNQLLNLRLLVDESAYQQFMKNVQDQEKVNLDVELNLLYNLPGATRQKITLDRQLQVPVPGQGGVKVAGLTLQELDPDKGAYLTLKLDVQRTNLPDLIISNLDYKLQLGEDLTITGETQEPVKVNDGNDIIEVPIHLSAEDVNQLFRKAIKGNIDWNYELQASAQLQSSNKMIGPTTLGLEFSGELEMAKGMGGKSLMPKITRVDSLFVTVHYDTAWVKLNINVKNPLPINIHVDSLGLKLSHDNFPFVISHEEIAKVLPADSTQSAWITLKVNYGWWRDYLEQHQQQDSLSLTEVITLVYRIGDLSRQRVTIDKKISIPMPGSPVAKLQKLKFRGISFTEGILLTALVDIKNANTKNIDISDIIYNVCVENLLDVSDSVERTYHIGQGNSIVKVPVSMGIGEVFRALFAKLSGNKKKRNIYINGTATISTESAKIKDTYLKFEKWEKAILFQNK